MKQFNRLISLVLAVMMIAGLVPAAAITVGAAASSITVSGVTVADGQYLKNGSTTPTTDKQTSGFAYYKDGVLTLSGYVYNGEDKAIESSGDLVITLVGNNVIRPSGDKVAIDAAYDLTVQGTGMLNITAAAGVNCGGVLTVNRGRLIVTSSAGDAVSVSDNMLVKGGTVSCTANVKTGAASALNVGGSIIVSGGSVSANGNGVAGAVYSGGDLAVSAGTLIAGATATSALEISGSAIITGGTVNAFSECEDAPAVNIFGGDFSVTSAEVEIAAIADGIYLGIGCFTLNSGSLDIVSEEGNAITVSSDLGDVFVYGGDLTVKAGKGSGIYSPMSPVTIGKGNVDITAGNDGIVSGSAIIVDAPVESLVIKSLNSDKDADYSALKIDDKDLLSLDSILAVSVSLSSDGSSAEALDTVKLGDYDYIYIRRPAVHVGGIGLGIGDYLAEGATASTATAVSGDRAYLEKVGGELRLNLVDFDLASDADGIVSDGALTLVLSGTSKISAKDYALMVDGALTIGAGNLELSSSANCAVWLDGDLTVEGNVTVNGKEAGIFGADTLEVKNGGLDVTSGKTGIYANNITVNGGELTAVSTDTNSDAEYSAVELLGGTLTGGSGLVILASVDPNGVLGAYNAADIATYDIIKVGTVAVGSVDLTLSDYDLDLDASGIKVTTGTAGIKLDSFGLCTDDAGTAADGKITHNVQYYLKAVLSTEEGYYFGEANITLDGVAAAKSELSDGVYTVYFKLDILERSTVVVGGTIKSYLDFTEIITVELYRAGSDTPAYTTTTGGQDAIYSFGAVEPGEYILKVSKADHVTREYAVTADSTDITLDLKIHLCGDINGDGRVNTADVGRANAHAKRVNPLEGYEFACADVNNDGRVNTADVGRMNAHAKRVNPLW